MPFTTLELVAEQESRDGTIKALFKTADGHPVEAVLMRYRDGRRSLCLSSQSGCPLTCTFCATGSMRFRRNLTESEILDQALHFRRKEPVNHAVYMGMGEPFLNFDAVVASARRLPELGITHRRTTISTIGWMPGLQRFVDEVDAPIRLALSIHAADPQKRSRLMPVNDRYPLADVLAECRRYAELRNRKVFVEYVMLAGVNDSLRRRAAARRAPGARDVQGQPDPLQPDRAASTAPPGRRSLPSSTSWTARASRRPSASPGGGTSTPPAANSRPRPESSPPSHGVPHVHADGRRRVRLGVPDRLPARGPRRRGAARSQRDRRHHGRRGGGERRPQPGPDHPRRSGRRLHRRQPRVSHRAPVRRARDEALQRREGHSGA